MTFTNLNKTNIVVVDNATYNRFDKQVDYLDIGNEFSYVDMDFLNEYMKWQWAKQNSLEEVFMMCSKSMDIIYFFCTYSTQWFAWWAWAFAIYKTLNTSFDFPYILLSEMFYTTWLYIWNSDSIHL